MFECLEGVLLVVRHEFDCDVDKGKSSKDVVGGAQLRGMLKSGYLQRNCKKEQNNILHKGCDRRVGIHSHVGN